MRRPAFLAALLAALLLAGGPVRAAETVFPLGSALGLVPAPGLQESKSISGFEDAKTGAAVLMVDMPPEAYDQILTGFTDAALATKGIAVQKREPFPLPHAPAGTKAVLVTGTQSAGLATIRKWVLLAGNDLATAIVTVQVPPAEGAALSDEAVRDMLASLAFRSPQDQMQALPFTLSNLAGFRVMRVLGNTTVMLTDGPKNVVDGAEQPLFVVSIAAGTPREEERGPFAIRALSSLPGIRDLKLERAEPLRMANQPGFEVVAIAHDARTGAELKLIQWMRFGPNAYLRMVGVVQRDAFPDYYGRLRAIRDGLIP